MPLHEGGAITLGRITMTTRLIGSLAISVLLATPAAFAQDEVPHYLAAEEAPSSLDILPPPPAYDSVAFLLDRAMYDWGKAQRDTPRGEQAYEDADVSSENIPALFSEAFGHPLDAENAPEIYELLIGMKEDAGDYATAGAKQHYNRVRPFAFFGEPTCRPDDEAALSTNGSYPSGHTTIGFALALVLAEINPDRQTEILQRGLAIGESRVICGYHWQSDIDAARIVAAATVATLHGDPEFIAQLAEAKAEFEGWSAADQDSAPTGGAAAADDAPSDEPTVESETEAVD
jgi:acid phosphatase (class A)